MVKPVKLTKRSLKLTLPSENEFLGTYFHFGFRPNLQRRTVRFWGG